MSASIVYAICFMFINAINVIDAQHCENVLLWHTDRMCVATQCDRGTQPVLCEYDGGIVECEDCPPGTYKSERACSENSLKRCKPHRNCTLPGKIVTVPGTRIRDTVCGCNLASGYYGNNGTACMHTPPCQPGQYMTRRGCTACPRNTTTLTQNYALRCINCRRNPAACTTVQPIPTTTTSSTLSSTTI